MHGSHRASSYDGNVPSSSHDRKDIAPEPEVSKQQIKSQLNVIGCTSCPVAVSVVLVIEALGYFPACPSAKMAWSVFGFLPVAMAARA